MQPTPDEYAKLNIQSVEQGCASVIGLRAQPGAKTSAVAGVWNGLLKICVRAAARDGAANEELLAVLARTLGQPASRLILLTGARSRQKRVRLPLSPQELRARLERARVPDKS